MEEQRGVPGAGGCPLKVGSSGSRVLSGKKVHGADCGASSMCEQ